MRAMEKSTTYPETDVKITDALHTMRCDRCGKVCWSLLGKEGDCVYGCGGRMREIEVKESAGREDHIS